MTLRAALLALCSALGGGAIALLARKRPGVLERTRTFAFAAAAGVVAFHLLPEVLPEEGLAAFAFCGVGFALPWLLEAGAKAFGPRLLRGSGFSGARVAAEVGFAALVFHSLIEGLALVAALAQPRGKLDLEIALVAHHAPLTAAVVLPFLELKGPRSVAARAVAIGACGAAGALASGAFPGFSEGSILQKATAVTAGALLHVVADEIRVQRFTSRWERAGDLLACVAGLLMAGLSTFLHLRHQSGGGPMLEFLHVLLALALAAGPALLVGTALATWSRTPRFDALLLALALLGPAFAACLTALAVVRRIGVPSPPASLAEALRERGPRIFVLLVAAAVLQTVVRLPASPLATLGFFFALFIAARLDEAGAVAVAFSLLIKGLSPAVALVALAAGPLARPPFAIGRAALSAAVALGGVFVVGLYPAAHAAFSSSDPIAAQVAASPWGCAASVALLLFAFRSVWMQGARGWFAPLRHRAE